MSTSPKALHYTGGGAFSRIKSASKMLRISLWRRRQIGCGPPKKYCNHLLVFADPTSERLTECVAFGAPHRARPSYVLLSRSTRAACGNQLRVEIFIIFRTENDRQGIGAQGFIFAASSPPRRHLQDRHAGSHSWRHPAARFSFEQDKTIRLEATVIRGSKACPQD